MAPRIPRLEPGEARHCAVEAAQPIAPRARRPIAPAIGAGPAAAGVVVADAVVADVPAAVDDCLAVVVPEDAAVRRVVLAEHDPARIVAVERIAGELGPQLGGGKHAGAPLLGGQ